MHLQSWTAASLKAQFSDLERQIHEHIPLKDSVLKEAQASGLGFKTRSALTASLASSGALSARVFSKTEFVRRIAELVDDISAEVVAEVLDGARLEISVVKRSEQRQREDRYSDTAYDVDVKLTMDACPAEVLENDIQFFLPEFGRESSIEPYRVDSAHDRRAVSEYPKTRFGAGQVSLAAKLVGGHWYGGFYVYAPAHQADDKNCIRSLKASLARAILPRLPTRVRCTVFRPDNYDLGAWRVEMRLPPEVQRFWNGATFQFDLPQLPNRLFRAGNEFGFGPDKGCFVGGVWKADLYSNGIPESENPTSLSLTKRELIHCVGQRILDGGYVLGG